MPGKYKLAQFIPRYKLTKKKYKFIVEVLKDVGVGMIVALLLIVLIEGMASFRIFPGVLGAVILWYIGIELTQKT